MPKVIVEPVSKFEKPSSDGLLAHVDAAPAAIAAPARLTLENGETYTLDQDDRRFPVWAEMLQKREGTKKPIYLEAAPDDQVVRILLPLANVVLDISEDLENGGRVLRTLGSPRLLRLRPDNLHFLDLLQPAMDSREKVLLTTDPDTGEVLHVRPFEPTAGTCEFPTPQIPVLTPLDAQIIFDDLAGQSHIPFDFPRDCCTARAHEMGRLLRVKRIECGKIWNYGDLRFDTPRVPEGFVKWVFHVATFVHVAPSGSADPPVIMVMDPSLDFAGPATVGDWQGRQQDAGAFEQFSAVEVFWRSFDTGLAPFDVDLDPFCAKSQGALEVHRFNRDVTMAMAQ